MMTEAEAYRRGIDCAVDGPNEVNAHFSIFLTGANALAWTKGMRDGDMLKTQPITFGVHVGKALCDASVPDKYVEWMARRGSYRDPKNRFETVWKVPIRLSVLARREMERRGYIRTEDDEYVKLGGEGDGKGYDV